MPAERVAVIRPKARPVAIILLLSAVLSAAQEDSATPPLRATTLSGVDVTVPDPEKAAVVVVGFGRGAGPQVRAWRLRIDAMDSVPSVASVLVIDEMARLLRATLARAMRGQVPEARQDTIYLVTQDGQAWRDLVRAEDGDGADDAYVLRFDGRGRVCFRHAGAVTDAAASALLGADCGLERAGGIAEQPADP